MVLLVKCYHVWINLKNSFMCSIMGMCTTMAMNGGAMDRAVDKQNGKCNAKEQRKA
uniref:Uncharacterized protein n=1 Tax=Arundo donax TaxID=35708 RepID=A0A0A8ZQJ1_ARUDO